MYQDRLQRPVLVEQPVSGVVARGQPVTLNCRAIGRPPPRILWLQDGEPVDPNRPDRLTLTPGSLFFLSAKERDAGVYQCRAENDAGTAESQNATLVVAMLRDTFREEPVDTRVEQGGTALLKCDPPRGHPEVKVTWIKDDLPLLTGERVQQRGSTLYILSSRPSDSGRYVCLAENVLGARRSKEAVLTVLVQPFFMRRPESSRGLAGGSLVLVCDVSGVPRPRVHWRRLDGALPVGRLHYTEENSMRIDHLRGSDAGLYICEAENGVGRVTANVTVTIQEAPTIDMPSEAVATVGGHMAVQCHVRGQPTPRAIWWRETEFEPLLADQERGRLSTSVQHELYIAPVTADDLGWWVCGATNAAGSVTGRVLLADSERPLRRRGAPTPEVTSRSDLDRDLVHLAELQVVRPDSVRITWKVSNTSPVDGFYICLISGSAAGRGGDGTGAPGRVVRGAPVLPGRPGPVLQRVPVLNGGADSYVLTRLSAGQAYEVFLVPFRQGLEGRLSNLQHVQMPETAPSAAPNDLQLSTEGDSTLITWSGLADSDTNGVVRGYSVLVLSADPTSGRPQQRLFNTSAPFARLAGRPDLRVRVAAFTAAGVGPYSAWVGPVQGWPTSAPPPATAAVPFGGPPGGGSAPPAALVAALGALCLAALGAALLTLHCRRLRAKQQRLDMAATMYADVKLPVIAREPRPDVLTRNTLWLRDDLFLTSLGNAQRSVQSRERRDELQSKPHGQLGDVSLEGLLAESGPEAAQTKLGQECHIYVNELPCSSGPSSKEVRRVRRAPSRGRESVELMTSGLESETESELERLTRRVRSLRPRASRSLSSDGTSGPSVPSRASRPSLRLRHDRRGRAPHSPQLSGGTYQECCCYECDYRPPPLPPDSSYDSSSSDFTTLPDLMTRSAPVRSAQFQPPHPLAPPATDRVAHSFPAGAKDGATLAALGVNPSRRASSDDVGSASDSGSSLYAETELNDAPRHNAESDVSSDVTSSQHKLSISKPPISSNSDAENNSSETTQTFICAPGDSLENCDLPKSPIDVGSGESLRSLNNGCTDQYSP